MRTAALFAVPVWALYVLWAHRARGLSAPPRWAGAAAARLSRAGTPRIRAASASPRPTAGSCTGGWARSPTAATPTSPPTRAAVRPQRPRPARGCGVPHLERRRPGPPRVRRHEPRSRRAGALERCAARVRVGDHPRPPGPLRASWSGTTSCATSTPGARARGQLRPRRRHAAVRPARAPQRDRPRSLVPRLRAAREPRRRSACATTTSASTRPGR